MVGTHFETQEQSREQCRDLRDRRSATHCVPRGFTLTELLVVITIIAILASLITGAAINALGRAKEVAITTELQQIGGALEEFKNEYGAYPPNAMIEGLSNNDNNLALTDFERMFKKAFPRNQEDRNLIRTLAGGPITGSIRDSTLEGSGMNAAEAIVFWLGGFSDDPAYPISGPGGPSFTVRAGTGTPVASDEVLENRNWLYEFDLGRLLPRKDDGTFDDTSGTAGRYIIYRDNNGIDRRINFWSYSPTGSNLPIAYFDTSRHSPVEYDLNLTNDSSFPIYAIKQLREGADPSNVTNADISWVEDKKFQLLHCGTDDIWGDAFANFRLNIRDNGNNAYQSVLLAPEGPFIGDIADTLGNFMTGTLEDKQE